MKTLKHKTIHAQNLRECQEHLLNIVASRAFLHNEGLNNEVPFHICPYDPMIQQDMTQLIKQLRNDLDDQSIITLEINLYSLFDQVLKYEDDWQ